MILGLITLGWKKLWGIRIGLERSMRGLLLIFHLLKRNDTGKDTSTSGEFGFTDFGNIAESI